MNSISLIIFRLSHQWFALPSVTIKEVIHRKQILTIPHNNRSILMGYVNLHGELKPSIDLHSLFQLHPSITLPQLNYQNDRMIAITNDKDVWIFPVDEIDGLFKYDPDEINTLPENTSSLKHSFLKNNIVGKDKTIGLIDEKALFEGLKRELLT